MRKGNSDRGKQKEVSEAWPTKEKIHQSCIMVEWRQTSGFQATLLVLVPSGGGGGWGRLNRILASAVARCVESGEALERCGKHGV